jgi:general secretion pathway protein G
MRVETGLKKGIDMRNQKRRTGFTIIEIMVVAVILAMLATFIIPNIGKKFGKAKAQIARAKMSRVESALEEFRMDCGRYPTDSEGLDALLTAPADLEGKWDGPYGKESEMLDPWNNRYIYVAEGTVNPGSYDIISLGADGQEGGDGENADIVNK